MKNKQTEYIVVETTKISIGIGYSFEIDGEDICIDPQKFHHYAVTQYLANHLKQLNPEKGDDKSWQFETMFATDYEELHIKQLSWNVISVNYQFHDGSGVERKLCDAKAFYKELIRINEWAIEDSSIKRREYVLPENQTNFTLLGLKDNVEIIKGFTKKYYKI